MHNKSALGRATAAAVSLAVLATAGCRVDQHKTNGNEDVKISTPFGGMSVKTDDNATQTGTGLTVYPGATLYKEHHVDKDGDEHNNNGAADIHMSFGSFHLGVKAVSYTTPDAPEKVLAFYRKDMARYGTVIFCKSDRPVGTPTVTQDGLTCDKDSKNHVHVNDNINDQSEGELKTGSKLHQRIVSVDAKDGGTKFGLVMLDLPGHLGIGDDKDDKDSSD